MVARGSGLIFVALAIAAFSAGTIEPALAELHGGYRASFVKSFGEGCLSSAGTERLVVELGGSRPEKEQYCSCVANAYADRLSIETIEQIREIERLAIADVSRRICLAEVFPGWAPEQPSRQFYPMDAETLKSVFSWTTDAQPTLSVDVYGDDRSAQIVVINASTGLFCWSEPLSVDMQILGSSPEDPVISGLWCEDQAGGYGEVFRIAEDEFVVGFALEDAESQWFVHEIELAR